MDTPILQDVPLFRGLSEKQLDRLLSIGSRRRFVKEETIFSQGEDARGFFVVLSGRVKVFKLSLEGKEQILHLFGPGEPIGEVPVFAGETFPAHAQALEASELLFLPGQRLRELFREDPSLAMNMLGVLSRRLREFTRLIEDLSLKELPARLAAYILELQELRPEAEELTLDMTKGTLAKILGTSQETLSRMFRRMSEAGLIEVRRSTIRILDEDRLVDVAEGFETMQN